MTAERDQRTAVTGTLIEKLPKIGSTVEILWSDDIRTIGRVSSHHSDKTGFVVDEMSVSLSDIKMMKTVTTPSDTAADALEDLLVDAQRLEWGHLDAARITSDLMLILERSSKAIVHVAARLRKLEEQGALRFDQQGDPIDPKKISKAMGSACGHARAGADALDAVGDVIGRVPKWNPPAGRVVEQRAPDDLGRNWSRPDSEPESGHDELK